MTALGYVRRSKESGARTVSLEDQRARIADYCHGQGWALVEVLADDGVSGGRRERLERLAERVKATGARTIVVYHLDRFARDLAGTLDYVRGFSRRGVELHVVGRGRVEADTASGFIVTAVEGLAAEHYRRVISEKTRDALARLRANGRRVSRWAPYGARLTHADCPRTGPHVVVGSDGKVRGTCGLGPDPPELTALTTIRALARGRSLRELSRALTRRGILARTGRPFAASTLALLVHNRPVVDSRRAGQAAGRPSAYEEQPRRAGQAERDECHHGEKDRNSAARLRVTRGFHGRPRLTALERDRE